MSNWIKVSFILILLYFPFFFLLLIPSNSILTRFRLEELQYEVCSKLPTSMKHIHFFQNHCNEKLTIAVIKPDGMHYEKEIMHMLIKENGFTVRKDKVVALDADKVREWYADKQDAPYFKDLLAYLTRDKLRVLQLSRINGIDYLRRVIGPTNPIVARHSYPKSIRAYYGKDIQENAIHASDSGESAEREFNLFFGDEEIVNTRHLS